MQLYETLESGIKIVEFDPSHAPSLAEFWNICGQNDDDDWGGDSGISTAGQVLAEHQAASHFNVFIALDEDDVVGYCSFGRYYADANTLYIPLLGVRPDYRSKKLGKALVLRCVQRTIELGYPRLDLFTWSGNTAAVPLYKKCGFMWEDRPDGTHFANFIPSIVTSPIFADFFKKADWYADSKRSLEIVPDGTKVNGFECFEYLWEKDGETLAIGYERSGRQMRMIETPDYKIELMAGGNELAFGTEYDCTFAVENKTGKPLNIKIAGREDKNIKLNCSHNGQITGKQEISAKFYVGAVDEPQDEWKVHPCLLADVEINGQAVVFGLGINSKFPLLVNLTRECMVDQVGMDVTTHISIQTSLQEDAEVTIKMPKSTIVDIKGAERPFVVNVPAKGKASISTTSTTLAIGYEKLELDCTAVLKSGEKMNFIVPFFIVTRDMTHTFCAETLQTRSIYNGPWKLTFDKDENEIEITHLTNKGYSGSGLLTPKLGKPYDDEFNVAKPNIKTYTHGNTATMEVEYVSEKFPGLVVTQIHNLYASGLATRVNKVENRADKPRTNMLQDNYWLELGFNTIFSANGQITQNHEPNNPGVTLTAFENVSAEDIDENWVYEDSAAAPRGFCWPSNYKPVIKWGSYTSFEIDMGELAPGQVFETKPVVCALGLFTNFNEMRNYARQVYNPTPAHTVNAMEVVLNGYNPFAASPEVKLDIINNRDQVQEGTITVHSESLAAPMSQTNPHEDIVEVNSFDLPLNPAGSISMVNIAMGMVAYEKTSHKAIFHPKGEVTTSQEGTAYCVTNGAITFKADPNYGHGCYSLTDAKGQEWLLSQYPEHKPFSWFNPFIGGIRIRIEDMDERAMLKEKITADFVKLNDNMGNQWQGVCLTVTVTEDEKLKGAVYKSYFLTQPGLPVLCAFYHFENGTGEYKSDRTWISSCINPDDDLKKVIVEVVDKDRCKHRRRMGSVDMPDTYYKGMMTISSTRDELLYAIGCSDGNDHLNDFWGSNKVPVMAAFSHTDARAAHGEVFTSSPAFYVITHDHLPQGALGDLERITFKI